MGDSLNLCIRSQEQNAKPSSFVAGPVLVLNWSFTCQFAHSLVGQLHREPKSSAYSPWTWFPGSGQQPGDRQRPIWKATALTSFSGQTKMPPASLSFEIRLFYYHVWRYVRRKKGVRKEGEKEKKEGKERETESRSSNHMAILEELWGSLLPTYKVAVAAEVTDLYFLFPYPSP